MRVCVFCASSAHIDQKYFEATKRLAEAFIDAQVGVVFGGGAEGLMGALADVMSDGGGKIQGVMPHFMKEVEWAHPKVKDFIFVETMHQRKAKLIEDIDALVALPGGTGTLEELFEIITLKRLGRFTKPIVILNTDGYYDPLVQMLNNCVAEKFMNPKHLDMWTFVNDAHEVLPAIAASPIWKEDAINYATLKQEDL